MQIAVKTKQVSETSRTLEVAVSSHFEHDIPVVSDTQSAEQCLNAMVERHGYEQVYKLVRTKYIIEIQAPARIALVEQWHKIPPEERAQLIKMPTATLPGEVSVATAELPEAQQKALQARMDAFVLGERTPRTRVVEMTEDPIDAIARKIQDGEIVGDELDTLRARAAELLGLAMPRRR